MAIETLNFDGKELKVADLPAEVQRLVNVYEITHNKRLEIENEHIQLSAALRQLSADISAGVRAAITEQGDQQEQNEQESVTDQTAQ